ncbi:MAG: alpha-L-fucosidase [Clostridia bacterium]|nr:alpha-L-fucosidase [Clostridia bacterium]
MYQEYESDQRLVACVPSERQLAWQRMEFYAFAHITVNTFTDKEWGDGTEPESVFDPKHLDADQWVAAVKAAGMTGLIVTAKHHDGFCLWPSAYTEHSVKNSPFRGGKGDVVKETAEACRRGGIRFGVYLSPWDRNCPLYGQGKPYDDYYCNQLTELLTNYGDLFCVWFDGACGEGPNGKKQVYDWDRYYALIRELQPSACISISGPDVRWCGNEAGVTRESEWSVIPRGLRVLPSEGEAAPSVLNESSADLGSRALLERAPALEWKPAETDTSIRPGWFWHRSENRKVKSVKELTDLYLRTVGGNSTLLLNIPPDPDGLFSPTDVARLEQMGTAIRNAFAVNLAADAVFTASADDGVHTADNLREDDCETYFKTEDGDNAVIIDVKMPEMRKVHLVKLKENIRFSQRIERFAVEYRCGKGWKRVYEGTTVGYQKICRFRPVTSDELRIVITDSRVCPVLSHAAVY